MIYGFHFILLLSFSLFLQWQQGNPNKFCVQEYPGLHFDVQAITFMMSGKRALLPRVSMVALGAVGALTLYMFLGKPALHKQSQRSFESEVRQTYLQRQKQLADEQKGFNSDSSSTWSSASVGSVLIIIGSRTEFILCCNLLWWCVCVLVSGAQGVSWM